MNIAKKAVSITTAKMLAVVAALAGLIAMSIQNIVCFVWFHQPETPACLLDNDM